MSGFFRGVVVGIGIGFLVAPMPGEDLRRLLRARYEQLRGALPEQFNQPAQQISGRVSQTARNLKESAQQAATKTRETGSALGELAQQSAHEVQQTGQDIAGTAKKAASSVKQSAQASTTTPDDDAVDLTLEY